MYSETVIPRLARAAQEVTGMPQEELMESFGVTFVSYVSRYGYDRFVSTKRDRDDITSFYIYTLQEVDSIATSIAQVLK